MNTTNHSTKTWLLSLIFLALHCLGSYSDEDAWQILFDGKGFDGWEGNYRYFRIEDHALVGGMLYAKIPRNQFLATHRSYRDFELQLEFKLLGEDTNAGIQLRSQRIPDHHEVIGYQADLGQSYTGCLYDESRRNKILAGPKPGELAGIIKEQDWNVYRILCIGNRIRLWINGHPTVDYTEEDSRIVQEGVIALQIHSGPPGEVHYRRIRLREL